MENIKFKLEIECSISQEQIDDLMATALEGGINYWCEEAIIRTYPDDVDPLTTELYTSDMISRGGVLHIIDVDAEDAYELTLENFIEGVKLEILNNPSLSSVEDLMDNYDAETADSIVQYALFGELRFS